jgi:hypothetical protein
MPKARDCRPLGLASAYATYMRRSGPHLRHVKPQDVLLCRRSSCPRRMIVLVLPHHPDLAVRLEPEG